MKNMSRGLSGIAAIVFLSFMVGCAPNLKIEPMVPDAPSADRVCMDVSLELSEEFTSYTSSYKNHMKGKVFLGDALKSYGENVAKAVFIENKDCAGSGPSLYCAEATLIPHLAFTTDHWSGTNAYSDQVTEVIIEWSLISPGGELIWSDLFRGAAEGNMGTKFSSNSNLQERTTTALSNLFTHTVDRMIDTPEIRLYSLCSPLFALDADDYVDTAKRILDDAKQCPTKSDISLALSMFAVDRRSTAMIDLLHERGIDLDRYDRAFGTTPLGLALRYGDISSAEQLVALGANPDFVDPEGRSLFFIASAENNQAAFDYLASIGASVHDRDGNGYASLASAECHLALAEKAMGDRDASAEAEHSQKAIELFSKSESQFQDLKTSLEAQKDAIKAKNFFKNLAAIALTAFVEYGSEMQARNQQLYYNQMGALRDASASGSGMRGYRQNLARRNAETNLAFTRLKTRTGAGSGRYISSFSAGGGYASMETQDSSGIIGLFNIEDTEQIEAEIEKLGILSELSRQSADSMQ